MASLTKELSKSISGIASATNAIVQATANLAVSTSNITTQTVDELGNTVSNLTKTSTVYSNELLKDAEASAETSAIKRQILINATKKVAKNEVKLAELETKLADSLIADLLEDLD